MDRPRTVHGSAVARDGAGVLILGVAGAGKSSLVLRLLGCGFCLVADDRVVLADGYAAAPDPLAGLLEVRGLGLVRLPHVTARLVLAVRLGPAERLPQPSRLPDLDLPVINLDAGAAAAPHIVALALDCLQGKIPLVAGAFA
jgi:HPr kinase/phosphorylase